jgi:hypothetical protein
MAAELGQKGTTVHFPCKADPSQPGVTLRFTPEGRQALHTFCHGDFPENEACARFSAALMAVVHAAEAPPPTVWEILRDEDD